MKLINIAFLFVASVTVACGSSATKADTTPGATATNSSTPGGSADQPAPPADEQLLILFEQLATDLGAAGTDCDKYAQSVSTFTTANGARYTRFNTEVKTANLSAKRLAQVNQRLETSLATVVKGYNRCRNSDAASKAFKSFDSLLEN